MASRNISNPDFKRLYSLSAGRCNICGCELFGDAFHIGEMGHIAPYSDNPKAPRAEYKMINSQITNNGYDNLILLCANCHIKVDSDTSFYNIEKLKEIKKTFESNISAQLSLSNTVNFDKKLVGLISKNYNLQSILFQLDNYCSINIIPFDITDIGDIEQYILEVNRPAYYPFNDDELNRIMSKILENYYVFWGITWQKYILNHSGSLVIMDNHRLSTNEEEDLKNALSNLTKYLYEWLKYCRENNYL